MRFWPVSHNHSSVHPGLSLMPTPSCVHGYTAPHGRMRAATAKMSAQLWRMVPAQTLQHLNWVRAVEQPPLAFRDIRSSPRLQLQPKLSHPDLHWALITILLALRCSYTLGRGCWCWKWGEHTLPTLRAPTPATWDLTLSPIGWRWPVNGKEASGHT